MRGLSDLIEPLQQLLPPEVLILLLAGALLLAAPSWWRSVKVRQIKGSLRRAARAHDERSRNAEIEAAFRHARGRPRLLVDLAEHASRSGLPLVMRQAVEALEATHKLPLEVRRLRREAEPDRPPIRDMDEVSIRATLKMDRELWTAAAEILDEAAVHYPDHPELERLRAELERRAPERDSDAR